MELPVKYREFLENALEYVKDDELWETFVEKVSVDAYCAQANELAEEACEEETRSDNNITIGSGGEDGIFVVTNDDKLQTVQWVKATGRQSVSRAATAVVASVLLEKVRVEKGLLLRAGTKDATNAFEFRTALGGAEGIVTRFAPTGLLASGDAMGAYSLAVDALLEMASEKATFCDVMLSYNNGHVVEKRIVGSGGDKRGESCVHAAIHSLSTLADIFSRMLFWEISANPALIPAHSVGGTSTATVKQSQSVPADSASLETWWNSFVSYQGPTKDACDTATIADKVCQRQSASPHLAQFIASSAIREAAIGMVPECYKMLDEVKDRSLHSNLEQNEGDDEAKSVVEGATASGNSDSSPRLRVLRRLFQTVAMCRIIRSMVWSMFANEVRRQQQQLQQQVAASCMGGSPNTASSPPSSTPSAPGPPSTLVLLQKVKTALRKSIVPDTQLCLTRIILPLLAVATSQTPQSDPHSQGNAVSSANNVGGEREDDDDHNNNNELGGLDDRSKCRDPLQDLLVGNDIQPSMVSLGGGGDEPSRVTAASSLSQRAGETLTACPPALAFVFDSFVLPLLEDLCWIAHHDDAANDHGGDNKNPSEREKEKRGNPHRPDAAIKEDNIPIANTVLEVMGLLLHTLKYGTWNENTNTVALLRLGALLDSAYTNNTNNTNSNSVAGAAPAIGDEKGTTMVTWQTPPLNTKTKTIKMMVMSPLLACLVKEREAKYQTAVSIYKKRMASMMGGATLSAGPSIGANTMPNNDYRGSPIPPTPTPPPPRRIMFAEPKREALGSYDGDSLDYLVVSGGCIESEKCKTLLREGHQQEEDSHLLSKEKGGTSSSSASSWAGYCLGRCESLLYSLLVPHNYSSDPAHKRDGTEQETKESKYDKVTASTPNPTTTTTTRSAFNLQATVIRRVLDLRSTSLRDSSATGTATDMNVNVREWWDANATDPTQRFSDLVDPVHAREMPVEQRMVRMESRTKALAPFAIFDDDDEDYDVANEREHGGLVKTTTVGGLRGGGIGFYNNDDDRDSSVGYVWLSHEERAVRRGERALLARLTGKIVLSAKGSSSTSSNHHRSKTARDFINLINNIKPPPMLRSPAVTTAYLMLRLLQQPSPAHAAGSNGEPLTFTRSTVSKPTQSSSGGGLSSLELLHSFAPIAVNALKMTPPQQQKHNNVNGSGGGETDGNALLVDDDADKDATRDFIATLSTSTVVLVVLEKLLIAYLYHGKAAEESVGDVNAHKRGNNKYTIDFPEEFLHAQEERTDALLTQEQTAGGRDNDETNNATTTSPSSALRDAGTHEVRSSPIYHAYAKLAQCLVTIMLTCPSGEHRCFARRVLGLLLDCFAIGVRRKLLSALFSLAPTGRAAEAILAIIKAEVMSDSSGHASSPNVRVVGKQETSLPQKAEMAKNAETIETNDVRCSSTSPTMPRACGTAADATQITIAYASQPERFLNHHMALEMVLAAKNWFNRNIKLMRQHEWVGAITAVTQLIRLVLTQELRRIEGTTSAYVAAKGGDLGRTSLSFKKTEEEEDQRGDISEALGFIVTSLSLLSPEHRGFSLVTPFDLSKIRRCCLESWNKKKTYSETTNGAPSALISPVPATLNPHRICLSYSSSSASLTTRSQSGAPANEANNNNNSDLGGLQHKDDATSILLPERQRGSAEYVVGVLISGVLNPLKEYLSKELLGGVDATRNNKVDPTEGRERGENANKNMVTAATISPPLSVSVSSSIMTLTGSSNNNGAGSLTPAVLFGLELAVEGIEGLVQRVGTVREGMYRGL